MVKIYPSLMAADQLNIEKEVQLLSPYCAGFHCDVVNNNFLGTATINAIAAVNNVWVHLMIDNPISFYKQLILKPDSFVSFHIESGIDFFGVVKIVREKKHRLSIAISPKMPVVSVVPFLNIVDQVLLMSVEPGLSGQPFLTNTFKKLDELVACRREYGGSWKIGIDGGVNAENIVQLAAQGVDDCAIGGGIFNQQNSVTALQELRRLVVE
jgi:ribulose-phosphate 3-epimerase